jgi:hypothetical protein
MHTTVRIYSGMPGVAKRIAEKRESIEKTMRGVPGFTGYRLVELPDGLVSVTICETQAGCEESSRRAAAWLQENLPDVKVRPPTILTGESHLSFGAKPSR